MKKHVLCAAAAAMAFIAAAPASAATFLFTFAGVGLAGGGTFTTADTPNATGGYLITGTTGTLTTATTTLSFTGPTTYAGADNLLYAFSTPYLSFDGTSVVTSTGVSINFYYLTSTTSGYRTVTSNTAVVPGIALTSFTVTPASAVPEPASWALMIGGFGLAGGALRTRATRTRFAAA